MKPMEADLYINKIAEQTGISVQAIRREYETGRQEEPVRPVRHYEREMPDAPEITSAERTLLKLMLMDLRYTEIPEDIRSSVFRSEAGGTLYQMILEAKVAAGADNGPPDLRKLREMMDPEIFEIYQGIDALVIPEDKERIIYDQCISFVRREGLKQRDQEITWMLSLDDGTISEDEIRALMKEQAEIQKQLKGQGE